MGFVGTVSVFERSGGWCVRVEISWDGILDLVHFSEGYVSLKRAKNEAQCAADLAVALRQSSVGVPSG